MSLQYFGEAFAGNVLRKFYSNALTPAITNQDYEGEIKKIGDRCNILMFLGDVALRDYSVGTDMTTQHMDDTEAQLVVEKIKYFNFDIDKVDKLRTYAQDPESTLIQNAEKSLEKEIDKYVLEQAYWVKAGNFIGINQLVIGDGADTSCSIATSATGGTINAAFGPATSEDGSGENMNIDGNGISDTLYRLGFGADVVGKAIRLVSQSGYATDWYRITAASSSSVLTVENWDSNVGEESNGLQPQGEILYGLHGAGLQNADQYPTSEGGWGYEIQGAIPTTVTATNVYAVVAEMKAVLDENDVPETDRMLVITPALQTILVRASQVQTDIEMYHREVVINGKVGRIQGFDIHLATGGKISTRAGRSTAAGEGSDTVVTAGTAGHQIIGLHKSFCTFAHKWSESRTKEAELQFANLYQGLNLYGAKVLNLRRNAGVQLYCNF